MSAQSVQQKLKEMNQRFGALAKATPPVMTAFRNLMGEASHSGVVPARMKELVAVAIAVHQGCEDCILFHVANARGHGAGREELVDILGVCIEMGGGPSAVYAGKALEAFDALVTQSA